MPLGLHELDGDVRAVTFTLGAPDAALPLYDFVFLERENLDRADLDADDAALTIVFVPDDVDPLFHLRTPRQGSPSPCR